MKKIANLLIVAVIAMMTLTTACSGAKDKALSVAVEQINEQLKGQKMPGIEEMSLSFDDGYVIYNYVVDEELSDMATIKAGAEESKKNLKATVINQASNKAFIDLVKSVDRGLKFDYKGNKSGKVVEIVFEKDEL